MCEYADCQSVNKERRQDTSKWGRHLCRECYQRRILSEFDGGKPSMARYFCRCEHCVTECPVAERIAGIMGCCIRFPEVSDSEDTLPSPCKHPGCKWAHPVSQGNNSNPGLQSGMRESKSQNTPSTLPTSSSSSGTADHRTPSEPRPNDAAQAQPNDKAQTQTSNDATDDAMSNHTS